MVVGYWGLGLAQAGSDRNDPEPHAGDDCADKYDQRKSMSFGNFQLHRPEPGGHAYGRFFERLSRPARDTESAQQIQPVRESSDAFSGRSKTDLTVLTAEGDRIAISLAAQVQYAASSRTGPGGSSETVATSTSSQLRVGVEGDLNETELKDLGTLLGNLAQATSEAGQESSSAVPGAPAFNAGFTGLASLAAFAYSYKQIVESGTLVRARG
jgi:hypothetical protein